MRLSTCSQFVRGRVVATRAASQVRSISAPKLNAIAPSEKPISMDKPDDILAGSTTVKNIEPTVCPPSTDDYSDNLCTQDGKSVSDDIALLEKASKEKDGGNNFGPLDTITSDVHVEPPQSTVPIAANFKQQVQPMEEFFGCHTFPKGAGDLHKQDSSVTEQTTAADEVGSHAQLGSPCKDAVDIAPSEKPMSMEKIGDLPAGSTTVRSLKTQRAVHTGDVLGNAGGALECLTPLKHFPVQIVNSFDAGLAMLSAQEVRIGFSACLAAIGFGGVLTAPKQVPFWLTFLGGMTKGLAVLSTQNVRIGSLGVHFLAVMGFGGVLTAPRHLPFWLTFLCAMTEYKLCLVDDKEAPPILQTPGNQLFSQESISSQVPAAVAPKQSNEVERSAVAASSTDTTFAPDDASIDSRGGWRRQLLTVAGWITNWAAK